MKSQKTLKKELEKLKWERVKAVNENHGPTIVRRLNRKIATLLNKIKEN